MRKQIEDVFLEWQTSLERKDQERVHYEEYDASLQTVFVERLDGFDKLKLSALEAMLQDRVCKTVLVSSLHTEGFDGS